MVKRYKFQALVTPLPQAGGGRAVVLTGAVCRIVVRARHRKTAATQLFSALVSASGDTIRGDEHLVLTVTVLGDDVADYLAAGRDFTLWRGGDIGRGVVTRRVFV